MNQPTTVHVVTSDRNRVEAVHASQEGAEAYVEARVRDVLADPARRRRIRQAIKNQLTLGDHPLTPDAFVRGGYEITEWRVAD